MDGGEKVIRERPVVTATRSNDRMADGRQGHDRRLVAVVFVVARSHRWAPAGSLLRGVKLRTVVGLFVVLLALGFTASIRTSAFVVDPTTVVVSTPAVEIRVGAAEWLSGQDLYLPSISGKRELVANHYTGHVAYVFLQFRDARDGSHVTIRPIENVDMCAGIPSFHTAEVTLLDNTATYALVLGGQGNFQIPANYLRQTTFEVVLNEVAVARFRVTVTSDTIRVMK